MEQEVEYSAQMNLTLLYLCWRKGMDITFGLLGIVILLLLLPAVSLLIYLDSPGPIFYKQERIGYLRKKFCMYKFRSMYVNADRSGNAIWAQDGKKSVTRIGRILRASHLDELPQVINILRGEMSLIGPRPEQEQYVIELEQANPLYRCRLAAKPGLTGWAQVNYSYGSTCQEELVKLQHDLYYIEHQSVKFDMLIILKTIPEVVRFHGI